MAVKGLLKWDLRERELELERRDAGGGLDVGKVKRLASIGEGKIEGWEEVCFCCSCS